MSRDNLKNEITTAKHKVWNEIKSRMPNTVNGFTQILDANGLSEWQSWYDHIIVDAPFTGVKPLATMYMHTARHVTAASRKTDAALAQALETPRAIMALDQTLAKTTQPREKVAACLKTMNGKKRGSVTANYAAYRLIDTVLPPVIELNPFQQAMSNALYKTAKSINSKQNLNWQEEVAVSRVVKDVVKTSQTMRDYSNERGFWEAMQEPDLSVPGNLISRVYHAYKSKPYNVVQMSDYGIELTANNLVVPSTAPKPVI